MRFQQIGNAKNMKRVSPVAFWRMRCFRYSKHISSVTFEHGVFQTIAKLFGNRNSSRNGYVVIRRALRQVESSCHVRLWKKKLTFLRSSRTCARTRDYSEVIVDSDRGKNIPIEKHQLDSRLDKNSTRTISKWEEIKEKKGGAGEKKMKNSLTWFRRVHRPSEQSPRFASLVLTFSLAIDTQFYCL